MKNLRHVSVGEFLDVHGASCDSTVIDVRQPEEFKAVHVKGARLFPLSELQPNMVLESCGDKDGPIYVLCKAGGRAKKAAVQLAPLTSRDICVVDGGTDACVQAGAPLGKE